MSESKYWMVDPEDPVGPHALAQDLLGHHPHLADANIAYVFHDKKLPDEGREEAFLKLGKAGKISDANKALQGDRPYDFRIQIWYQAWQEIEVSSRRAWMDHLLSHCHGDEEETTGDMKFKIKQPTISTYPEVIARHGINWHPSLAHLNHIPLEGTRQAKTNAMQEALRGFGENISEGLSVSVEFEP